MRLPFLKKMSQMVDALSSHNETIRALQEEYGN